MCTCNPLPFPLPPPPPLALALARVLERMERGSLLFSSPPPVEAASGAAGDTEAMVLRDDVDNLPLVCGEPGTGAGEGAMEFRLAILLREEGRLRDEG